MNGNKSDFQINDLIFAKVKGYPYWPAKIVNIDSESFKYQTKYHVNFFGTNESAVLNKGDICLYNEHKFKYTVDSVALKYKEDYKVALLEVGKAWEGVKIANRIKTPPSGKYFSTQKCKLGSSDSYNCSTPIIQQQSLSSKTTLPKPMIQKKDAAVNTPKDMDLQFQLEALTDKCISLERSFIEGDSQNSKCEINKNEMLDQCNKRDGITEDFHTLILKQELCRYKSENEDLKTAIKILQDDFEKLKDEVELKQNKVCLKCYPPLKNSVLQECSWTTVNNKANISQKRLNEKFQLSCENSFEVLSDLLFEAEASITEEPSPEKQHLSNNYKPAKTKKQNVQNNNFLCRKQSSKLKIKVFSDSHGRNIPTNIYKNGENQVSGMVKPGACFKEATDGACEGVEESCDPDDFTVFIAGANDVAKNETSKLLHQLKRRLLLLRDTHVIVCSVPHRYDLPDWSIVNKEVQRANEAMKELCNKFSKTYFLDLSKLGRRFHTEHGLHFNVLGKAYISSMITKIVDSVVVAKTKKPAIVLEYVQNDFLGCLQ